MRISLQWRKVLSDVKTIEPSYILQTLEGYYLGVVFNVDEASLYNEIYFEAGSLSEALRILERIVFFWESAIGIPFWFSADGARLHEYAVRQEQRAEFYRKVLAEIHRGLDETNSSPSFKPIVGELRRRLDEVLGASPETIRATMEAEMRKRGPKR